MKKCLNGIQRSLGGLTIAVLLAAWLPVHAAEGGGKPAIAWKADDSTLQWGPCPNFMPIGCAIAVLHGDPSQPNLDVFFKVPAHSDVPLHWHTSAERMVLVAGELHVTYRDQEPAILKPGMYAYGPAKLPHSARCSSDVECVLFIAFESALDAVAGDGAQ